MSQSGFLTEDELRDYMNEYYNLKIERDLLSKPTPEFVINIYSKILDDFFVNWREPKNLTEYHESNIKLSIVRLVRLISKQYNLDIEFNIYDLLKPNRKRTTYFLNMLLFNKASYDETFKQWLEWNDHWNEEQKNVLSIERDIENTKLQIEELSIQKANSKSIHEIQESVMSKRKEFDNFRDEGDHIAEEGKKLKNELIELAKMKEPKEAEDEDRDKQLAESEKDLKLLNDAIDAQNMIPNLDLLVDKDYEDLFSEKEYEDLIGKLCKPVSDLLTNLKIENCSRLDNLVSKEKDCEQEDKKLEIKAADLERTKTKKILENQIKLEQVISASEEPVRLQQECKRQKTHKSDKIEAEIEAIESAMTELRNKHVAKQGECQDFKSKAVAMAESMSKKVEDSWKKNEVHLKTIEEYKRRQQAIIGSLKEKVSRSDITYTRSDITYTKESRSIKQQ